VTPFVFANVTVLLTLDTGEDALANLSIEKEGEDGPITGFVRIRSRSQGLALALGSLKGLKAATA
jgi:coatomer subunit beta